MILYRTGVNMQHRRGRTPLRWGFRFALYYMHKRRRLSYL